MAAADATVAAVTAVYDIAFAAVAVGVVTRERNIYLKHLLSAQLIYRCTLGGYRPFFTSQMKCKTLNNDVSILQ